MTTLFDGVIFARKSADGGWVPHTRKDGQPAEKKQVGGRWAYRIIGQEEEPEEPVQPILSDAERMLADPTLNLANPATRGVLHDALLDSNRDVEAAMLGGPLGETLVLYNGRLRDVHTVPDYDIANVVASEMDRIHYFDNWRSTFRVWQHGNGRPAGTIVIEDRFTTTGPHRATEVPAAALIGFIRRRLDQNQFIPTFGATFIDHLNDHVREEAHNASLMNFGRNESGIRVSPAIAWSHAWLSSDDGPVLPPHIQTGQNSLFSQYRIRTMPITPDNEFGERGYYFVYTPPVSDRLPEIRAEWQGRCYRTREDVVSYIRSRIDTGGG